MNYPGKILTCVWGAVLLLTLTLMAPAAPAGDEVPASAVSALLAGNWQQVDAQLPGVTPQTPSPVLRLIKGHACLALNRNNEATCLFQSVSSPEELAQWQKWAETLAQQHQGQAVAGYCLGDAQARLGQWAASVATFSAALKSQPRNAMLLNARGVAQAAQKKWDHAVVDFADATQAQPSLADAHANRGTMYIHKKDGAEGALKSFDRALKLSPDSALALNGRACAEFALGRLDEARKDFQVASGKSSCLKGVIGDNIAMVLKYIEEKKYTQVAHASEKEAGFELERRVQDYMKKPSSGNYDKMASAFSSAPANAQGKATTTLTNYLIQSPNKIQNYKEQSANYAHSYQPGGKWDKFYTDLSSVKSEISSGLSASARKGPAAMTASVQGTMGGSAKPFADLMNQTSGKRYEGSEKLSQAGSVAERTTLGMSGAMKQPVTGQGGIKMDLSGAHLDRGDWPFVAQYGLFYRIAAN
jgi:tetratricopeptide (TPR) repeat protein